ncbi:hypothetical protein OG21DRAFT_1488921 [Imleria badia]|nr:hypothetical protein OG21DRAFT_1488921 [Imleria badia]
MDDSEEPHGSDNDNESVSNDSEPPEDGEFGKDKSDRDSPLESEDEDTEQNIPLVKISFRRGLGLPDHSDSEEDTHTSIIPDPDIDLTPPSPEATFKTLPGVPVQTSLAAILWSAHRPPTSTLPPRTRTPIAPHSSTPQSTMPPQPKEIKAALPADFSGEPTDATRWIKPMRLYFIVNQALYTNEDTKVATTLNKMSKGRGVTFSEKWYDKLTNTATPPADKTFDKPVKKQDGTHNDGFQTYITNFQNIVARVGTSDPITLVNQFSLGLDPQLVTMILSMATIPTTIDKWIDQSKIFHAQKMRIKAIKGRHDAPSYLTPRTPAARDPNTMDVDAITLIKLTPAECARCIKTSSSPRPQSIRCTDVTTNTPAVPPTPATLSAIDIYVQTLTTQGKSEAEVLQTLKMCYEEPTEEVAITTIEEVSDF